MNTGPALKAPFPAFGGKSGVAAEVWRRFGDVRNYVEPFCFSAAVLLRRPGGAGKVETINDRNLFVTNFWRAVQADPERVAAYADWPVHEADLHARHAWLVASDGARAKLRRVADDPDFFDAKIAGWWCWGACMWIGSGWCDEGRASAWDGYAFRVQYNADGLGNGCVRSAGIPHLSAGRGVHGSVQPVRQLPHMDAGPDAPDSPADLSSASAGPGGQGVLKLSEQRPHLSAGPSGQGVLKLSEQTPRLSAGESVCVLRRAWILDWMTRLADRLRMVRVCCGHWSRVCDSPSTMTLLGTTAVFLDPPYRVTLADGKANRTRHIYANDRHQDVNALCDGVQAWCLKWGGEPGVKIALCGLEGEYPEIEAAGWDVFHWKSNGGYGNRSAARGENENAARERIWFSPGCVAPKDAKTLWCGGED